MHVTASGICSARRSPSLPVAGPSDCSGIRRSAHRSCGWCPPCLKRSIHTCSSWKNCRIGGSSRSQLDARNMSPINCFEFSRERNKGEDTTKALFRECHQPGRLSVFQIQIETGFVFLNRSGHQITREGICKGLRKYAVLWAGEKQNTCLGIKYLFVYIRKSVSLPP